MTGRHDQVAVGDEFPPFAAEPTLMQVVMYAAAMWEFQRIHFDAAWAVREGLPGPIAHGPLLGNYLAQALASWTGPGAVIRHLEWSNRGVAPIGESLSCGGVVTGSGESADGVVMECDVWIDNPRGERIVTGSAVVEVPAAGPGT
jgi:acyl dehydratase